MFMFAMPSTSLCAHQGPLAFETLRHLLENVLEHQVRIEARPFAHRAEGHRFLPAGPDQRVEFSGECPMTLFGPLAEGNQVLLEPLDGVAERPMLLVVLGAVARRIIAGRMRRGTIGHQLDQRRSRAGARSFGRPLRHRIDGEKIVAVDADAGDAVTRSAGREGALLPAGIALESRYGPLIVDHIENDRRLVYGSEQQSVMKIRLRTAALADPARGKVVFALDRSRHRPAHGLRALRG